jgi:hypothetical protein
LVPSHPVYPAMQVQIELFAAEKVLFGHAVQVVRDIAAISVERVFASQAMHIPTPVMALYAPAPHGVHATPSDKASYPARQVQDVRRGLLADEKVLSGHIVQLASPANEYVFTPHGMHVPTPVAVLYVPAPQGVHDKPSAPVYPAMHIQDVSRGLPTSEKVLFGHVLQFADDSDE